MARLTGRLHRAADCQGDAFACPIFNCAGISDDVHDKKRNPDETMARYGDSAGSPPAFPELGTLTLVGLGSLVRSVASVGSNQPDEQR